MIYSRNNSLIKQFSSLTNVKRRKTFNQFIASGVRICSTIMETLQPDYLVVTDPSIATRHPFNNIKPEKIIVVNQSVMEKIDPTHTTSGIVGIFPIPVTPCVDLLDSTLVLCQITDPGNMGTLIRTAAALGKKSIICVEGVDPWNPKVIQASAGTIAQLALFIWTWDELLENKGNKQLYALVVKNGKLPTSLTTPSTLLVVGNEAHGIPTKWLDQCDGLITIPMPGNTESLNAAVAGSLALYLINNKTY